ncbi:MAG: NAD(P)/FAD-dependent oxidoreductase [Thermoplasmatales archaeon]|nr:MAG: NAD(P)/FAD-dependent oxidoreductase [Thermoplasmatales archaeon]
MKYDVVIVGAGPSGSTSAKCLAEKGVKALLIDKKKFPRDKPCGGGLPTKVLNRFPYVLDLIESISYRSITYSASLKYRMKIQRDKPIIATILRKNFDYGLVKIAVAKGVDFLDEKTVTDIKILKDKAIIILEGGQKIESQIVIGADGVRSVIVEKSNLVKNSEDICVCLVKEQPMTEEQINKYFSEKRTVHIFIKILGIAGYGWIFPKKKHVNIGIGEFESAIDKSKHKKNLKEIYEKYIKTLKENNLLPRDLKINNPKGSTLPIFPIDKTFADRLLICGDAAGFINSITGEGIYYAMTSGEIAANVINEALKVNDTSEGFLSKYQKLWEDEFGKDLKLFGRFNKQWGKVSEKFVRLLTKDKKLAKLTMGVTGGQISISRYRLAIIFRYIYVSFKDRFNRDK